MRVLIAGWGYIGSALGSRLAAEGHEVFGLRRSPPREPLKSEVKLLQADISDLAQLERLPAQFDWVVNCAGASASGVEAYESLYLRGNRNLLQWLAAAPPQKFVYTSSTGVYGQDDGETVDESSLTEPASPTGRVLVATERLLLAAALETHFPVVVLRLAGIYGSGRGYWLRQFLDGTAALEGDGSRILNMIHRDDVVGAIVAALARGDAGEVFNVVDNEPPTQMQVFEWLSNRLGQPMPPPATEAAPRRRGATNKRVSNLRLRQWLRYELKYPSFREGYAAELASRSTNAD